MQIHTMPTRLLWALIPVRVSPETLDIGYLDPCGYVETQPFGLSLKALGYCFT